MYPSRCYQLAFPEPPSVTTPSKGISRSFALEGVEAQLLAVKDIGNIVILRKVSYISQAALDLRIIYAFAVGSKVAELHGKVSRLMTGA